MKKFIYSIAIMLWSIVLTHLNITEIQKALTLIMMILLFILFELINLINKKEGIKNN